MEKGFDVSLQNILHRDFMVFRVLLPLPAPQPPAGPTARHPRPSHIMKRSISNNPGAGLLPSPNEGQSQGRVSSQHEIQMLAQMTEYDERGWRKPAFSSSSKAKPR